MRRCLSVAVLVTIDVTACFAGIYAALALKLMVRGDEVDSGAIWAVEQKALPFAATTMVLVFAKNRLYAPREQRGGAARILSSVTLTTVVVLVVLLVAGFRFDTYYIFYSSWFLVGRLVVALRTSYDSVTALVLDALTFERRALLVGAPALVGSIAESLERAESRQGVPYRVVGRHQLTAGLGDDAGGTGQGELRRALDPAAIDEVILTGWSGEDAPVLELLDVCRRRAIPVRLAPTTAELLSHSVQAVPAPGLPLFDLRPPVLGGAAFLPKRAFDLVVGSIIGLLVAPVLAVAAIAIQLDDRGPVIHRSRRVGVEEHEFTCLKLRTMRWARRSSRTSSRRPTRRTGRSSRSTRTRASPGWARCCGGSRSTSCRRSGTCCAARCRSSGRGRCRAATTSGSTTSTRSATWCCRG